MMKFFFLWNQAPAEMRVKEYPSYMFLLSRKRYTENYKNNQFMYKR